jgi:hypothetical protein
MTNLEAINQHFGTSLTVDELRKMILIAPIGLIDILDRPGWSFIHRSFNVWNADPNNYGPVEIDMDHDDDNWSCFLAAEFISDG